MLVEDTQVGQNLSFDVIKIRKDFPILFRIINGKPLIYLDNAATSQKPKVVLNAIKKYYDQINSNVHRGVHTLSQEATEAYEKARVTVAQFLHAKKSCEIIYTRGATESINLVAYSYGRKFIQEGDEIIISELEHHSNIVPWQILCEEKNAILKIIPINDTGDLIMEEYEKLLSHRTRIVAVNQVSNSLGTINPVKFIIDKAHEYGAVVLIDGCQSVQHMDIDVQKLDCDFFCFSGHKIYGPTGIGVLYGKEDLLNQMTPYQSGGDMIQRVTFAKTTYNELPFKFEAGTPNIEGAIVLSVALDYLKSIGLDQIHLQEQQLLSYATEQLNAISGLKVIGKSKHKASVLSFLLKDIHPYDTGLILDKLGIAVRTGHHCTQPLMDRLGIAGTVRASFAFYNTLSEVDALAVGILQAKKMLQ
ncbi:MAG: SufS family cysteine desulfurase [Chitinophagaceae bacterium]